MAPPNIYRFLSLGFALWNMVYISDSSIASKYDQYMNP